MNKKFEKINVDKQTNEYIRYVAKALNKPISTMIAELFSQIVATCIQFKDGANWSIQREYDDCRIRFTGSPRIIVSHFKIDAEKSDAEIDEIIKKEMLEHVSDLEKAEVENKEIFGEE